MKKKLLLIIIVSTNLIHSQGKSIDEYFSKAKNLEHIGCVKSIFIEKLEFRNNKERIDTLKQINKVFYNNEDNMIKQYDYWKDLKSPIQITKLDNLNRVLSIKISNEYRKAETIVQYFRGNLNYPDSLNVYTTDLVKRKKVINHFTDNLVTRRDLIINDTLRYYTIFEYDSRNRLTKELNINTKNGFGTTINFTGSQTKKIMNRNDSIVYNYENKKDTLIVYKEQFKGLIVANKTFKNDNIEIKIKEEITRGKAWNRQTKFIWKDSTKTEHNYYKGKQKKELKSYYNTSVYKDKIISEWKNPYMMRDGLPKNQEITTIQTTFDKYGNWIKKIFIRNKFKEKEIKRIVEYNCH